MEQIKLPEQFLSEMKGLLKDEYDDYLKSFEEPRRLGLRANTLKVSPEQLKNMVPWQMEPVPWISNGFLYEPDIRASKDPYYYGGLYYLQEPSAMTPASLLPVKPGDKILDICAAPGGKSTELAARLKGEGMLFSNDISNSRAKALLKNLEMFGVTNCCVASETPEKLSGVFHEFFDGILIDAPCSGEGMFRKEPEMVKDWLEKGPEYYSKIQKSIIAECVKMLKPGGYLLYSTCTFSRIEDEETVLDTLERFPEMELSGLPLFPGACDSFGISGCIRLFPHKIKGEGHFVALMRKKADNAHDAGKQERKHGNTSRQTNSGKKEKLPEELKEFLSHINRPFPEERITVKQDTVYLLPEDFPAFAKLRYLRTGLFLGEMKKGRFEPSQALAMALKLEDYDNSISFSREDDRVIRYLKGETVFLTEAEEPKKGWCLVGVDGFPLGWAKGNGSGLKNKYYPGWRWQ